jgi:hypothetical protein
VLVHRKGWWGPGDCNTNNVAPGDAGWDGHLYAAVDGKLRMATECFTEMCLEGHVTSICCTVLCIQLSHSRGSNLPSQCQLTGPHEGGEYRQVRSCAG